MKRRLSASPILLVALALVTACAPATTAIPTLSEPILSPAAATTQPTRPLPSATSTAGMENPWLEAGFQYEDPVNDASLSFLDVINFRATVDDKAELLMAIFTMRDLPPNVERGRIKNVTEFELQLAVYLQPEDATAGEPPEDFSLHLWSFTLDPTTGVDPSDQTLISATGEPTLVPIDQLWTSTSIIDKANENIGSATVIADPDSDTLTLRGLLPGITSGAAFRYSTKPYEGIEDGPDDFVPDGPANPSGAAQQPTEVAAATPDRNTHLVPAGPVRAYPGPVHYAGDILTFEILTEDAGTQSAPQARLTLDNNDLFEISGRRLADRLVLPLALDTSGLLGEHSLRIQLGAGAIDETYAFEVLPAGERPEVESQARWQTRTSACCILHYLSGTAAARDIDLLAEHFQQGATKISSLTGRTITQPLQVYFIDRMWGNGAFGGDGELVASYTDRYYGPTVDRSGWETLARHEITHALKLDVGDAGFVLYNEGLAVFLAGGHFKPEPLDGRAAALYELGYFVPVGQSIGQHELAYLYGASLMAFIREKYGFDGLWKFVNAADGPNANQPAVLDEAIRNALGISLAEFQQDFELWLQSHDPGNQLDDLRLTIELQDLRREYQDMYAPPPEFVAGKVSEAVARPEFLPVMIREAQAPPSVAAELLIANAQRAIVDGEYEQAQGLIDVLKHVIATGGFEDPLAKDYLDIVSVLTGAGNQALSLELQGNRATAQVMADLSAITSLELEKVDQLWQIQPESR